MYKKRGEVPQNPAITLLETTLDAKNIAKFPLLEAGQHMTSHLLTRDSML